MSKLIPAAGTYPARINGQAVVYETEKGAVCVALPVSLVGSDPAWSGKHTMTIVKQDGTIQQRSIETLKAVFPEWDGVDPFWLEDNDLTNYDLEVVGEHENYTRPGEAEERVTFKIQWLNTPGGGGGAKMPQRMEAKDRKALLTKFGSKFKALSGGASKPATAAAPKAAAPTPTPAAQPAKAAPAKSAAGGPPGRKAGSPAVGGLPRSSSQEEVWTALTNRDPDKSPDEHATDFYNAIDGVKPGSDGSDLSPAEWGAVATALGL